MFRKVCGTYREGGAVLDHAAPDPLSLLVVLLGARGAAAGELLAPRRAEARLLDVHR